MFLIWIPINATGKNIMRDNKSQKNRQNMAVIL